MTSASIVLWVARTYFRVCMDMAEKFDEEIAAAKNRTGIALKYAHFISPKAWAGDWSDEDQGEALAWWMGARAFEIEVRDKLQAMFERGELKGFPMEKFTG